MWKFTADGAGSGTWSEQPTANTGFQYTRPSHGVTAYGNGIGYYLGGLLTPYNWPPALPLSAVGVPGLVTFNMAENHWQNLSSSGFSNTGIAIDGNAWFVPIWGLDGVITMIGAQPWQSDGIEVPVNVSTKDDTLDIYDPATETWYTQATAGPVPPPLWFLRCKYARKPATHTNGQEQLAYNPVLGQDEST